MTKQGAKSRSCTGKVRFTREQAEGQAFSTNRSEETAWGRRAYRCKFCGAWHVGRKRPARRGGGRERTGQQGRRHG